jgi:hypothetical protein
MADEWWNTGDFGLGDFSLDTSWFNFPDFSFDWALPDFNFPDFNFSLPDYAQFAMPDLNLGLNLNFDPLALPAVPQFTGIENFQPAFQQTPQYLGDVLNLSNQLEPMSFAMPNAPSAALPGPGLGPSGDPLVNLMNTPPPTQLPGLGGAEPPAFPMNFEGPLDLGGVPPAPMPGLGGPSDFPLTQLHGLGGAEPPAFPLDLGGVPSAPLPGLGGLGDFGPSPLPGGAVYAMTPDEALLRTTSPYLAPFSPTLNTELPPEGPSGATIERPPPQDVPLSAAEARQARQDRLDDLREQTYVKALAPKSMLETIGTLGAAFGPTAIQAAGLGFQQANRPQRNPLEDELLRSRIASTGLQDQLAKERLDFEKEQAGARLEAEAAMQAQQLEAQQAMQDALIASRAPGGTGNIQALLGANPQFAALYKAALGNATSLAGGGSPQFNAMLERVAQTDIAELSRQKDQLIKQANEDAARLGINPANRIAEVEQRFLQESEKARANARTTLLQLMGPAQQLLGAFGPLFGSVASTPTFQ